MSLDITTDFGRKRMPRDDDSELLKALERLRLEQAETNARLQQILVPLASISRCASAALRYVQQLAESCTSVVSLLEDCSRALRVVQLHTLRIMELLAANATSATYQGLLDEYDHHVERGMHVAEAACLLTSVTIGLPYRWQTCRTSPSWLWGLSSNMSLLSRLSDCWGLRMQRPQQATWYLGFIASLGTSAPVALVQGWSAAFAATRLSARRGAAPAAVAEAWSRWPRWSRSSWSSLWSRSWLWSLWGVGFREAPVLICRARLTGLFQQGRHKGQPWQPQQAAMAAQAPTVAVQQTVAVVATTLQATSTAAWIKRYPEVRWGLLWKWRT
ncbi:hypothetical protein Vretifemale_7843 [Volvox reticuliferus]|uniref:Uncharacterized protein n=1 Tax=Volvox reticuliferus TaxID=1737510 RepID=A0A8J4CFP9_9CHLO|nr:hypothetical protein Vretifemale_7843 [Volvox reticuliferus]